MRRYIPRERKIEPGDEVTVFDTAAKVLKVGPEQSEIKFIDNGNVRIVCNSWMCRSVRAARS